MSSLSASSKVLFSAYNEVDDGYFVSEGAFYKNVFGKKEKLFDTGSMKLKGKHNQENVMAALIISDILRFDPGGTISAAGEFNGLPHRIEYAGEVNGIRYYNDSKATNIDASIKAVRSFTEDMAVVLGGREKNTDFKSLLDAMPGSVKYVIAMGENAEKIAGIFGEKMKVIKAENMEEAVKKSAEITDIKVVLLSPACASFDMFRDYNHRGEEFKKQVRKAAENE